MRNALTIDVETGEDKKSLEYTKALLITHTKDRKEDTVTRNKRGGNQSFMKKTLHIFQYSS